MFLDIIDCSKLADCLREQINSKQVTSVHETPDGVFIMTGGDCYHRSKFSYEKTLEILNDPVAYTLNKENETKK